MDEFEIFGPANTNKIYWKDMQRSADKASNTIRQAISNKSVVINLMCGQDGIFKVNCNVFLGSWVNLNAKTLEGAKAEAIEFSRSTAETILNEICEIKQIVNKNKKA